MAGGTLVVDALTRLARAAVALVQAKRKASPGGKRITRNERRAIVRALLPELDALVRALDAEGLD